ncbi:MAG: single-stranded DNA-binding protein [Chitinophagaceae bacterium]|nr:single-stranded DNA-binding protein [Chitinophagaceae bacterium]
MQSLKNRVHLIGFLGNAPEIKKTENGKSLARFSLATNEKYTNAAGEKIKEVIWHNLIAWNSLAEIAENLLLKGSQVAIEGKLINRNYTDTEGVKRYVTEIQVIELLLLNSKASS